MYKNKSSFNIDKSNLSTFEAAAWLGISNASLFNLWKKGTGPSKVKIGRRTLVPKSGLEQFIASLQKAN